MAKNYDLEFTILSKKLIDFKETNNLSYQDITDALGANKSHIQRIATMETAPSLNLLAQLADFMKLPLFSLFVPSNEMIRHRFADQLKEKLESSNMELSELSREAGISQLRLQDLIQGTSFPSTEEFVALAANLHMEEDIYTLNAKETLLKDLLRGMDLEEKQITNILEYIRSHKS